MDQIKAAEGLKIEWHFSQENVANSVRELLKNSEVEGIEVIHTPKN